MAVASCATMMMMMMIGSGSWQEKTVDHLAVLGQRHFCAVDPSYWYLVALDEVLQYSTISRRSRRVLCPLTQLLARQHWHFKRIDRQLLSLPCRHHIHKLTEWLINGYNHQQSGWLGSCSPSSKIGSSPLRAARVTAGMAESNGSLLPGL